MTSAKSKTGWQNKIWQSNFFTLFLMVLLIFSFIKVAKEVMLRYEINQEINTLESKLNTLEQKTEKMDNLITYLQTDEYIEKEARLKLNLIKPGEKQINLSSRPTTSIEEEEDPRSNMRKWFDYFFEKI